MHGISSSTEKPQASLRERRTFRFGYRHPFLSGLIDGLAMSEAVDTVVTGRQSKLSSAISEINLGSRQAIRDAKIFGVLVEGRVVYGWALGAILMSPITVATLAGHTIREFPKLIRDIPGALRDTFSK